MKDTHWSNMEPFEEVMEEIVEIEDVTVFETITDPSQVMENGSDDDVMLDNVDIPIAEIVLNRVSGEDWLLDENIPNRARDDKAYSGPLEDLDSGYVEVAEEQADVESHATDYLSASDTESEDNESEIVSKNQICDVRPFDWKLLRDCVEAGEAVLSEVDGKDVVLIVGKTGVGKSLFVQGIALKKIVSHVHVTTCCGKNVLTNVFEAVDPLPGFQIGHDKVSKTKSINCFCRANTGKSGGSIVYIDSPGSEDTVGAEVDIATSIMLSQVVKRARTVRLVLLISYASLLEDRGGAIRGVLKLVHAFVSDFEKDKKSFMFLFTPTNEVETPLSLVDARSFLTDEILRTLQGTEDRDVQKILKFMYQALKNGKRHYVDVLNPLTADFVGIASFIEKRLSPISQPAPMTNCGLSPKSELKLTGQVQHMLSVVRRLIQSIQQYHNPETFRELKEIKDMFGYLSKYIGMSEIERASGICDDLFQNHVDRQQLCVQDQLAKVKDANAHFDDGNIQLLRDAISQLHAFEVKYDEGLSPYTTNQIHEAFDYCYARCKSSFHTFDRTIKDFNKMKVLKDEFSCCEYRYGTALTWFQKKVAECFIAVSGPKCHDFECYAIERISEHSRNLVILGSIVNEINNLSKFGVDTVKVVSAFKYAKDQIFLMAATWASDIPISGNDDWNEWTEILRILAERAAKLEAILTILSPHKVLIESIIQSLDLMAEHVQKFFPLMCAKVQDNPENKENEMSVIASLASDFGKIQATRWMSTKQIYNHMLSYLRNDVQGKAFKLENAAFICSENGLSNGVGDGELYRDFISNGWFDFYDNNQDYVRTRSNSAYEKYCCRMKVVLEQVTKCGEMVKLLSEKNTDQLQAYCKFAAELEQFNKFEATAQIAQLSDKGGKIIGLVCIQPYIKELSEETDKLCSRWILLVKEVSNKDELNVLTQNLDVILDECSAIQTFGSDLEPLKAAAVSSHERILSTLHTANVFLQTEFGKPLAYDYKASILHCILNIQGFPRTDCLIPKYSQFSEIARNLISKHSVVVEKLMKENVDTKKIEGALSEFREATILDRFTSNDATKYLQYLESLCDRQIKVRDTIIEDMIARKDFVRIGNHLKPLHNSGEVVKINKLNLYTREIVEILNAQIRACDGKLYNHFTKQDVAYVVDTLKTLKAVKEEIGVILNKHTKFRVSEKISRLTSICNTKLETLVSTFLKGKKEYDFCTMGINYHLATIVYDVAESFLSSTAKESYKSAAKKWNQAQSSVVEAQDQFFKTKFRDFFQLQKALSSLKQASSINGMQLPFIYDLYNMRVLDLSTEVSDRLRSIFEQVEETRCYNDGIPVLTAFEKAYSLGLADHLSPLPYDCNQVIAKWTQSQSKLDCRDLKEVKEHLDSLLNPNLVQSFQRFFLSTETSYNQLQDQMQQRVLQEFQEGISYLQQQDAVLLKESLDRLSSITENLDTHVPLASALKRDLEDKILKAFVDKCLKSVQYLERDDVINFETVFPELRLLAINFPFMLDNEHVRRHFGRVSQLVHDILRSRIDKLNAAVCNHDFLGIRNLIEFHRNHGAFLADYYGLLFEELKQRGQLRENKWLNGIWDLCREHFATGRDLLKIKSFAVLGIVPSASKIEIDKAYRQKARREHPDKKIMIPGDSGEEFRRIKSAHDDLLSSSRFNTTKQLFDELIREIPSLMEKSIRGWLSHQDYKNVSSILGQLSDLKSLCTLVDPHLDFVETSHFLNEIVKGHVHGVQLKVDKYWDEHNYQELNLCIEDLKVCEGNLSSFPNAFPRSWNLGIIEKVEKYIEKKGNDARSLLRIKETANERFDDFRRHIIEMGAILFGIQTFSNFTRGIIFSILESCLLYDWGYPYLFRIGLSLQKGDESKSDAYNSIGQSVVAEFSHFKEVLTMVWNEETSQKPPEDTVQDIKVIQPKISDLVSPLADYEKDALIGSYNAFETTYKLVLSEYLPSGSDLGKLVIQTIERAKSLQPLRCSSGWTSRVKNEIPHLLARIFAMFTIIKSGESYNRIMENSSERGLGNKVLMKPHNIQVLTLLQLLGCHDASIESMENQLMQIRTGEGKSMILGAGAALLGLLGFRVRCVCYSNYLSSRDYSLFEPIFKRLNIDKVVKYSMITKLSEDSTARIGDIRILTERLLRNKLVESRSSRHPDRRIDGLNESSTSPYCQAEVGTSNIVSSIFHTDQDAEEILLIDEVDVFFGSDFFGQTYNQVAELRQPEVAAIIISIWENFKHGSRRYRLADVQALPHYSALIDALPNFQFLIDQEILLMLDHVRRVDSEPYIFDSENDRIGYKVLDSISYNVTFGYQTIFTYLKEADNGSLRRKTETLDRVLLMPVSCGQFSYANIKPARILGVSGTIEAMGKVEKDVLMGYGIEKYVIVPSVYGQSNFNFDKAKEGIYIEKDKSNYFQKICDEIHKKAQEKRAIIVFFKDNIRLAEFTSSPFYQKLGRQKNILSENMDIQTKEFVINKAATSGQITLCTAVFGRGTDFFCKCEKIDRAGGVHIIQAFLSTDLSEEVQVKGRTARQGKNGSYQLILLESDLETDFELSKDDHDKIPRGERYQWLNNARKSKHDQQWQTVMENYRLATKRDDATHLYFSSLLRCDQLQAEQRFKDLYTMIKKPPIPEEINVDIAFLLDITGSMAPYCQHAISTIDSLLTGDGSILTMLKLMLPDTSLKLRFSFLAYNDIDDEGCQFKECTSDGGAHFTDQISKFNKFVISSASSPSGGKDICEDHLGAIDCCVDWDETSDWISPIKFICIFTDAPAHGLAPPCCRGLPNVDYHADCHPKGLTPASVVNKMITKGVSLLICSYNPNATAHMEQTLAEEYFSHPDNKKGKEVKCISMVPPSSLFDTTTGKPLLGDQPKHMIFILDESGSMQNDWNGVVKAFREYISCRLQNQNEEDLVSVVQFDYRVRITVQLKCIRTVPATLDFRGGGTQFAPAAIAGSKVTLQTPMSHMPTVVFMSDGCSNDAPSAAAILASLSNQVLQKYGNNLELHVIAFGNGVDTNQLTQISRSSPNGRIHLSSNTVQLTKLFVDMAGGQHVANALQGEIAREISEAVSDSLSLEYLS